MSNYNENLAKLIKPIFDNYDEEIIPEPENQIRILRSLH